MHNPIKNNNEKRHVKRYGEFVLFYQNVNNADSLVIGSKNPKNKKAWVIPENSAWMYADSQTGQPTLYAIEAALKIRELFGLSGKDAVFKIASAIVDAIPDLINLKPSELLL